MPETSIDLYRMGNASSPQMDRVRPDKDIEIYPKGGETWVRADTGGVSTFSSMDRPGK